MSVHSHTRLLIHLVWSTYNREKVIKRSLRIKLNKYLHEYAQKHSMKILASYVNADHVHILIDQDPVRSVAEFVKLLKGSSSRWLNLQKDQAQRFSWGRGYGAFSVSASNTSKVINYINNQDVHHHLTSVSCPSPKLPSSLPPAPPST